MNAPRKELGPSSHAQAFRFTLRGGALAGAAVLLLAAAAQGQSPIQQKPAPPAAPLESSEELNRRLAQIERVMPGSAGSGAIEEYRIGAEDLVEITVFESSELNRIVRVSAGGEISLPLVGLVRAAGLSPRGLESVLEELLRRSYVREPHVSVFVREMQSHPVSVFGAVRKPGVFQIRGEKTLIEVLALAEGLADDAGDTVLVERSGAPDGSGGVATQQISLKRLLGDPGPAANVRVRPGDIVKVTRAGMVYVVGEVRKPGGFPLRTNENISVLQALALAEGLTRTSAKDSVRIIRTDPETGQRSEVPVQLGQVLAGKAPDPIMRPRDVLFVPNSGGKAAVIRGVEAALTVVTGFLVFRM